MALGLGGGRDRGLPRAARLGGLPAAGVVAVEDSVYVRLDLALVRALYLARGPGRHAAEASRLVAELV